MEQLLGALDLEGYDIDVDLWCDREGYEPLRALATLTAKAIERYDREKSRLGVCDYDDLITETHRLLAEHDDQQLTALREDIRYVMIDEFQDTNHRQWELIRALVAEGVFDADNVFVVGDEKQSIYRFRNADVTVFDAAQQDIETANTARGTPDDGRGLRTNFRTLPATLDGINGLFESVFTAGPDSDYEVPPEPLAAGRDPSDTVEPRVEYLPVPVETDLRERFLPAGHDPQGLPESEPSDLESRALANRLAELLDGDTTVTVDGETDGSSVTPGDIAVLIRSRSDLKDYERALRRLDIPYRVVKGQGFFETPEIRALRALFETLVDPTDDIALYGALRSPLCGLADEELADVYDPSRSDPLWEQLQAVDEQVVRTAVTDIRRWRRYAGAADSVTGPLAESWSVLLDHILEETGYLAAVAADERGAAATANVDMFRDKLREFDADGLPSLERVVRQLDTRAAQGESEADANVVRNDESVTIMTIHEAKGQEFPVVVMPGIGRGFRDEARGGNGGIELERVAPDGDWHECASVDDSADEQGRVAMLGLKLPGNWGESDRSTFARHLAQAQRRHEEAAEEKRILYVGCTRAQDHLILTGQHTDDDDTETGVEAPEPADPSSMRDWVQAALFGADNAATELWTSLERDGQFTQELEFNIKGTQQSGTVTVRLPPQERDVAVSRDATVPATRRTSYTSDLQWEIQTSPSALSGLADGSVRWELSAETRQARTVHTDSAAGRSGQQQGGLVTPDGTHLRADVFGQAVHRLCEVRPPREEWPGFVRQVARAKQTSGDMSPADIPPAAIEAVTTAAASAVEYLDTLHNQVEPLSTHDEFPISVGFGPVELTGYIDHLAVTPDTYHIVDYKTDRQRDAERTSEFLDRRRAHHEPQVMAYVAALQAHDPTRDVVARLYFTDIDDSVRWTPGELDSAQTDVRTAVSESLPNKLTVERF